MKIFFTLIYKSIHYNKYLDLIILFLIALNVEIKNKIHFCNYFLISGIKMLVSVINNTLHLTVSNA